MNPLQDTLGNLTEFLKSEVHTETVMGKQFQLGEFLCVPVMSVGIGLGGGGGEGKVTVKGSDGGDGTGAGIGAGMGLSPIGFLATRGAEIQFISTHASKGLGAAFEKLPEMMEKFLDKDKDKSNGKKLQAA
jgi:uncharacterized spore protein YtfJ